MPAKRSSARKAGRRTTAAKAVEASFMMLDPRRFPDSAAAARYVRSEELALLLDALASAVHPPEKITSAALEPAQACAWALIQDVREVLRLAFEVEQESLVAARWADFFQPGERCRLLAALAVIAANDEATSPSVSSLLLRLLKEGRHEAAA